MLVKNHDIAGLVRRLARFILEMNECASAGNSEISEDDIRRAESYIHVIDSLRMWIMGENTLDLPKSHPLTIDLDSMIAIKPVKNESIMDMIYIMRLAIIELVDSQSASIASRLNEDDAMRLERITKKLKNFLTDFVKKTKPLDLPESATSNTEIATKE